MLDAVRAGRRVDLQASVQHAIDVERPLEPVIGGGDVRPRPVHQGRAPANGMVQAGRRPISAFLEVGHQPAAAVDAQEIVAILVVAVGLALAFGNNGSAAGAPTPVLPIVPLPVRLTQASRVKLDKPSVLVAWPKVT